MNKAIVVMLGATVLLSGCASVQERLVTGTGRGSERGEYWSMPGRIYEAGQIKEPIAPLTVERDISKKEAYEIQRVYNARMQMSYGDVSGYKVAYASRASQEKWNIDAPTFGTFFEKQQVENGGSVKSDDFILYHNETEVAFTIAKDIAKPLGSVDELMPYIASVHAGMDVPDNRFDKSKGPVKVADVIAMSCGTHTFVIGEGVAPDQFDYQNARLMLEHEGTVVYDGVASNVLGDPREAVLFLVEHLLEQGTTLKKGDVVLSGSVDGAYCPENEKRVGVYIGKVSGLPSVKLIVE